VLVGAALEHRALGGSKRLVQPRMEVAAVRERAPLHHPPLVEQVEEEPRPGLRSLRLVEDPQRAGGSDHQRRPRPAGAARSEIRAGAVDQGRIPARLRPVRKGRQPLLVDAEHLEELGVPAAGGEIEQAGARGDRAARRRTCPAQLFVEVIAEGHEAGHAPKDVRLGLGQPGELRRPEARVEMRTGSRLDGGWVDAPPEPLGGLAAAGVAPAQYGRQGPTRIVERDEAVPEAGSADRIDALVTAADHLVDEAHDLVGIPAVVAFLPPLVDRLGSLVEALRAHGGGADVEREHGRHAGESTLVGKWQS